MKRIIETQLEKILTLPHRKFRVADALTPAGAHWSGQGNDRLLAVLSGVKPEPIAHGGLLETVDFQAGDCYLLPRNTVEYANMRNDHELLCVVPRGAYLRVSYYRITPETPRDRFPEAVFFHSSQPPPAALEHTIRALENAPFEAVPFLLDAAFRIALRVCRDDPESVPGKARLTFERLRNLVAESFARPLTRESVAARYGLNPAYVSTLFREQGGTSFGEFLSECRLRHARVLLRQTDLPVKTVAELSGFGSEVYFIRRFRELTGLPPGAFRRSAVPGRSEPKNF